MATQGGSTAVWRIYEGQTGPLLRSFLQPITLPDTSVVFNGAQQSGAGAAGVTAASGTSPAPTTPGRARRAMTSRAVC
jgi:hypothetical protein